MRGSLFYDPRRDFISDPERIDSGLALRVRADAGDAAAKRNWNELRFGVHPVSYLPASDKAVFPL
ncbi:hypothetical protein [Holdemania massiliensis]